METSTALSRALEELELSEREFLEAPTTELATQIAATRQVVLALGNRLEQETAENERAHQLRRREEFEARLAEVNERLNDLYRSIEHHLTKTLDASDETLRLYAEAKQLESYITKTGGDVPVRERSLWSRYPKLREQFMNSLLRNGEP
jgi:hypothetical protein